MTNFIKNVQSFLKNSKKVRCPRCLKQVEIPIDRAHYVCPYYVRDQYWQETIPCDYEFPPLYVQNYDSDTKPVFVQVFGWSGHGKTVYLQALRLMLMRLGTTWKPYTYQPLTDRDIELSRDLRTKLEDGIMPDATVPLSLHDNYIYIMQLSHLLRWGSRFFVMMDHAGERFDSLEGFLPNEIPFLTHRDTTTLMFFSPPLLRGRLVGEEAAQIYREQRDAIRNERDVIPDRRGRDYGRSMNDLLTIYTQAMVTHDKYEMAEAKKGLFERAVDAAIKQLIIQRRKLVVVLTMSDMLINEMPEHIRTYLTSDTMWDQVFDRSGTHAEINANGIDHYVKYMERVSNDVRNWIRTDLQDIGGADFVKNIENNNIEARYSIVSALGHNQVSLPSELRGSGSKIAPKRVLDPFFWILEMERKLMGLDHDRGA